MSNIALRDKIRKILNGSPYDGQAMGMNPDFMQQQTYEWRVNEIEKLILKEVTPDKEEE